MPYKIYFGNRRQGTEQDGSSSLTGGSVASFSGRIIALGNCRSADGSNLGSSGRLVARSAIHTSSNNLTSLAGKLIVRGNQTSSGRAASTVNGRLLADGRMNASSAYVTSLVGRLIVHGSFTSGGSFISVLSPGLRAIFGSMALSQSGIFVASAHVLARGTSSALSSSRFAPGGRLIADGSFRSGSSYMAWLSPGLNEVLGSMALSQRGVFIASGSILAAGVSRIVGDSNIVLAAHRFAIGNLVLHSTGQPTMAGRRLTSGHFDRQGRGLFVVDGFIISADSPLLPFILLHNPRLDFSLGFIGVSP